MFLGGPNWTTNIFGRFDLPSPHDPLGILDNLMRCHIEHLGNVGNLRDLDVTLRTKDAHQCR